MPGYVCVCVCMYVYMHVRMCMQHACMRLYTHIQEQTSFALLAGSEGIRSNELTDFSSSRAPVCASKSTGSLNESAGSWLVRTARLTPLLRAVHPPCAREARWRTGRTSGKAPLAPLLELSSHWQPLLKSNSTGEHWSSSASDQSSLEMLSDTLALELIR